MDTISAASRGGVLLVASTVWKWGTLSSLSATPESRSLPGVANERRAVFCSLRGGAGRGVTSCGPAHGVRPVQRRPAPSRRPARLLPRTTPHPDPLGQSCTVWRREHFQCASWTPGVQVHRLQAAHQDTPGAVSVSPREDPLVSRSEKEEGRTLHSKR